MRTPVVWRRRSRSLARKIFFSIFIRYEEPCTGIIQTGRLVLARCSQRVIRQKAIINESICEIAKSTLMLGNEQYWLVSFDFFNMNGLLYVTYYAFYSPTSITAVSQTQIRISSITKTYTVRLLFSSSSIGLTDMHADMMTSMTSHYCYSVANYVLVM